MGNNHFFKCSSKNWGKHSKQEIFMSRHHMSCNSQNKAITAPNPTACCFERSSFHRNPPRRRPLRTFTCLGCKCFCVAPWNKVSLEESNMSVSTHRKQPVLGEHVSTVPCHIPQVRHQINSSAFSPTSCLWGFWNVSSCGKIQYKLRSCLVLRFTLGHVTTSPLGEGEKKHA